MAVAMVCDVRVGASVAERSTEDGLDLAAGGTRPPSLMASR
jgi:hypothetical protein